jgi:hypothetical protein
MGNRHLWPEWSPSVLGLRNLKNVVTRDVNEDMTNSYA